MGRARLAVVALVILVTSAIVVVGLSFHTEEPDLFIVITGLWAVLGAIIVGLRPSNAVGWLFVAVGLVWTSGFTATASVEDGATGRTLTFASWFSEWFWIVGFGLMIISLYLIPTGRVPSRGWRAVVVPFACAVTLLATIAALEDEVQASDTAPIVQNPIGLDGLPDLESFFAVGLGLVMLAGAAGAAVSLVVRYRRGGSVERQQLKLVALAVPLALVCVVFAGATEGTFVSQLLWGCAIAIIPIAVAVATLRYRLFDVDVLISRTLVYGLLTVLLAAAYVGLVLAGQALFSSLAGGGDLAIAVSTLVVAALFLPLRARVQRFVDRRFYRHRYDAQRTLEAFGARLRDQVELEGLTSDLRRVVHDTMQPSQVAVWLRRRVPE
jgi:hypothetical protein